MRTSVSARSSPATRLASLSAAASSPARAPRHESGELVRGGLVAGARALGERDRPLVQVERLRPLAGLDHGREDGVQQCLVVAERPDAHAYTMTRARAGDVRQAGE